MPDETEPRNPTDRGGEPPIEIELGAAAQPQTTLEIRVTPPARPAEAERASMAQPRPAPTPASPDPAPRGDPFGAPARRPAPVAPSATQPTYASDDSIVAGTGLRALPGEQVLKSLRRGGLESNLQGEGLGMFLTDRRLILHGTDRVFLIFPSGRKVRSSYLEDVDTAGVRTKRLPQWLLAFGLLFILIGFLSLFASGEEDVSGSSARDAAVPSLVLGGIAAALWVFVKREQVVFSVAGTDHFEFDVFKGAGGTDRAGEFISHFYELRPEARRTR